ncbi:MAG: TonB-dependent receptor, partial [Proteobacteria bacterium]
SKKHSLLDCPVGRPANVNGYAISEENFYKDLAFSKVLTRIKLHGSYGEVGNINIGNYPALFLYSPGLYGSSSALSFSQAGNPNLRWETSKKADIGINLEFLGGRFSLDVDYYHNDIDNLVQNAPQAPSKGIPDNAITTNIGRMYNKGLEFTLNSKNFDGEVWQELQTAYASKDYQKLEMLRERILDSQTS